MIPDMHSGKEITGHRDGKGHSGTQTVAKAPAEASLSLRLADAIHDKIREEGHYISKAVYTCWHLTLRVKGCICQKVKGPTSGCLC